MHATASLSLPREPSSVTGARQVLATLLNLTEADEGVRGHLAVIISEACANAVTHSTPDSPVDVSIVVDDRACSIEIGNRGATPDGDRLGAALPDPLTVGGRGLPLITALADSAAFVDGQPGQVLIRIQKQLVAG